MKKDYRNLVIKQLQEYLERIEYFYNQFLETKDAEALHQFRVYIRKSRSILKAFEYLFVPTAFKNIYKQLSKLADATNRTRDLDVFLALKEIPDKLHQKVLNISNKEHKKLEVFLRSDGILKSFKNYRSFLKDEEGNSTKRTKPCEERLESYFKTIEKHYLNYVESQEKKELHRVRIILKKVRYYLEAFNETLCASAYDFVIDESKSLQKSLGNFNDVCNQQVLIRSYMRKKKHKEDEGLEAFLRKLHKREVHLQKEIQPLLEHFVEEVR